MALGVEIRKANYLVPDYCAALSRHNVAHVFDAWTRMPTIAEQFAMAFGVTLELFLRLSVRPTLFRL
jgi:hypothetical protein